MKIQIELTEGQLSEIAEIKEYIVGSGEFVIPAQIKIPQWDNSLTKPVVKGKVMTGDDAIRITKFVNDLLREMKQRDNKDMQKDIEV